MPLPRNRSRSKRRIFKRTPGGRTTIHYKRREKGKVHYCAICHAKLQGTHSLRGMSKSEKRPERLFGGHLCHACTEKVVKYAGRLKEGIIAMDDIEIRYRDYVKQLVKE
ncbi:50S ribosomal protein L34e [Candidatus Micrarchaeota archaeon]|nr:50S ribosomal protein L34e [Candidatus Micrarchaeota archaeon]